MPRGLRGSAEEAAYGERLLAAYSVCFPPARVSVQTTSAAAATAWGVGDAAAAARVNLSMPVLDWALGRLTGEASRAGLCTPHMLADASQAGDRLASHRLEQSVRSGAKLTARDKAELSQLSNVPLRVTMTTAYAANRCLVKACSRACVPVFFQVAGQGHANLLMLELNGETLQVTLYEPNGAAEYGTLAALFPTFDTDVGSYLAVPRRVTIGVRGQGLQTALGETSRTHRGLLTITRSRGYPVCEAVVLYLMRRYMEESPGLHLEAFEQRLIEDREDTRDGLLRFVEDLARWVQESYAAAIAARLRTIFFETNVVACKVTYGDLRVDVPLIDRTAPRP